MVQPVYTNEIDYIKSRSSLQEELTAIEAVRTALLAQMLVVATGKPVQEYMLNDGQTTIKRVYRTTDEIMKARAILQIEANEIRKTLRGGGVRRMVDSKNFIGKQFM